MGARDGDDVCDKEELLLPSQGLNHRFYTLFILTEVVFQMNV